MRQLQNSNNRRLRNPRRNNLGNNNNSNNNNNSGGVNRVYDSNGPDGKLRGTPMQICEKYIALAKDAQVSGDNIKAESYLQYADHYNRILLDAVHYRQNNPNRVNNQKRTNQENKNPDKSDNADKSVKPHDKERVAQQQTENSYDESLDKKESATG